jgi:hypothetical protein
MTYISLRRNKYLIKSMLTIILRKQEGEWEEGGKVGYCSTYFFPWSLLGGM